MSQLTSSGQQRGFQVSSQERNQSSPLPPLGLLLAGLAVASLGATVWSYLGPDLRRYLKIRNM